MDYSDTTSDDRAIRALFESWYAAMEGGDVDKLVSLVTSDVVVKPADAPPFVGKNALQDALSAFLGTYSETVDYDIEEIEVGGQLAFVRILESARMLPRSGGDATTVSGMHLTILRRQPDSEWLIARDISSLTGGA